MIILKTIRYVKEAFDSTSFQFYYLNTVRIIKIAWSNQCQFSDSEKSFSLMVLSELSRTGIINPENININQSIKEFVNKIHPIRKEPFLGPVSTSIIQACVTESIWECSELIGAALINIKIQNTDEKFCRSICLSYSMIINMAFTSANMHLIIFMITGTADRTIDLAIKIAQCHRAIISSDQFHAVEINESIGDDELILLPTIFALLAYSSKPCPTNLLNARFKIYFSKPLVDIFICSLEPVLLVLEIFSERFQGNLIESFPILNEMILSFSLMFDKNLSEFMAESIPGIFYFVSNQLWCPVSKSTHYWTIRELTVLAMFFEISKAHLGNRIEECVSFLMGKYHPHILETQYTEHIVRIIIENIKTSSNSQKVYRFIASWAPWIAIDPEFDQYSDFEVTSTITSNVLECRSSNKYEITNQNNMIDIKEFSDDLIEVLNIRRGLTRCSDIQILCTLIIHNCRTWVYQSSMSEDDIMSVNYIVQECLEILQLRQSFDNAWDKDILFSEPWANEFWKRLSTEMKMFLHPLLNSRYSCISQYTVNEFIYEAMSHESFGEILNRFFQTIKIPSALLSRLRSIFVLNLWQGDFPGSMISLESIDDNVS